jgi:TetR/AcrR family transcriptional repressor of nem operon
MAGARAVQAVIVHQIETILGFQELMLSELDSFEALEAWRDAIVAEQWSRDCVGGCPLGSLAGELADQDAQARVDLAAAFARWQASIRDGLCTMQDRGELGSGADPDSLALAMLTALRGGLLMTQTRRDTVALETVLNAVIDRIRQESPSVDR